MFDNLRRVLNAVLGPHRWCHTRETGRFWVFTDHGAFVLYDNEVRELFLRELIDRRIRCLQEPALPMVTL